MKQIVIKPPIPLNAVNTIDPKIFLAGSIEMGTATDWQVEVTNALKETSLPHTILNPRRDDWDSSWVQSINNPQFREQVEWEMSGIQASDILVVYFDPDTKSPISLLELGMSSNTDQITIVCCPDGYWRKGNVEVFCNRYGLNLVDSLETLISEVKEMLVSYYVSKASMNDASNERSGSEDTVSESLTEGEKLSDEEKAKKEEIVKELKKKKDEFKEKYGDDWESVMYATATKLAKE